MDAHLELIGENRIDHAMPLDAGLALKTWRHDLDAEMAFTLRVSAGVAMVLG